MFRAIFAVALLAAPAAHAWQVVAEISLRLFGETTVHMLAASSKASTDGSAHGGRPEQGEEEEVVSAPSRPDDLRDDDPPPPPAPEPAAAEPAAAPEPKRRPLRPPEPPPAPPSVDQAGASEERPMMLWRKSTELYLREHASQLKQDVALGNGPVITALAATQVMPPARLGQLLRANHQELLLLIGDHNDTEWPQRFLKRVYVLHSRSLGT